MNLLKTKQFNRIRLGSVHLDFFDYYNYIGDTTRTVDVQFISHYAFQSGNRSSSGEILQTHKDKAAPFGKTKIVSGFLMVFSNCFH